jgi:hypothetical protein
MPLKPISVAAASAILLVVSSAMLASPEQTQTPGQMTQARVWIENRGSSEAIPVDLRAVNVDKPLRVQIINGEPAYGLTNPVVVRPIGMVWEYQTLTVAPDEDLAARLNALGRAGWETAGVVVARPEGTTVLLKRSRQQ